VAEKRRGGEREARAQVPSAHHAKGHVEAQTGGEGARRKAPKKRVRHGEGAREMVRSNDGSGGRVDKGFNSLPAWGKGRESGDNVTGTTAAAAFIYWHYNCCSVG
jgi:hypothetical protein